MRGIVGIDPKRLLRGAILSTSRVSVPLRGIVGIDPDIMVSGHTHDWGVSVPLRGIVGIDQNNITSKTLSKPGFRPLAGNCRYRSSHQSLQTLLVNENVSVPLRGIVGIDLRVLL